MSVKLDLMRCTRTVLSLGNTSNITSVVQREYKSEHDLLSQSVIPAPGNERWGNSEGIASKKTRRAKL